MDLRQELYLSSLRGLLGISRLCHLINLNHRQVIMDPHKGVTQIITRHDPELPKLLQVVRQGPPSHQCLTKELADPILVGTHLNPTLGVV